MIDLTCYPKVTNLKIDITLTTSLLISTSSLKALDRFEMIVIALISIFIMQTFHTSYSIFSWILNNHEKWVKKGIHVHQIIDMKNIDVNLFFYSSHYVVIFVNIFQLILWGLIVFIYKKNDSIKMPWALL